MNRRILLGSLTAAGLAWSCKTPRSSEVAYFQRFLAEHELPAGIDSRRTGVFSRRRQRKLASGSNPGLGEVLPEPRLPAEWVAKVLGAPKAPAATLHYFTVLHCEFTPPGSPEAAKSGDLGHPRLVSEC